MAVTIWNRLWSNNEPEEGRISFGKGLNPADLEFGSEARRQANSLIWMSEAKAP
eukprot:CAMPEP_0170501994 /NCGR_PEP_ID=MMETSP0208-20121228/40176_1 /TAXON_ID=197538 /ORGANISM="Strombidium inclinatum, Strain S3" /LENGTH=53 /DNA_ID=CAMNT_0010780847 /DNA_START=125 /DNA_END=283 /DNA_ORIENTATION=+